MMELNEEALKNINNVLNFLGIMKSSGDHPKNVIKLTNKGYSLSGQRYPDCVTYSKQLAG